MTIALRAESLDMSDALRFQLMTNVITSKIIKVIIS